jgi:hypothetical protein
MDHARARKPVSSLLFATAIATAGLVSTRCGGSSPTPTPTPPLPVVTLSGISLAQSSVVVGTSVQGTATLSGNAPSGGATVNLTSSNTALATVPATVSITAGTPSAPFTVSTTGVSASTPVTISGSYNGGTVQTGGLTITPIPLVASFVVTGPSGNNNCKLQNSGNSVDCTFDGSGSTGSITTWLWKYARRGSNGPIGSFEMAQSNTAKLSPSPTCNILNGVPSGTTMVNIEVHLQVRDTTGTLSGEFVNTGVSILPKGNCGF